MADEKIRIMIVDDVENSQKGLARLLSFEADMDVIGFASSGAEAIERAQKLRPDVILMDINMPDMDGLTATEEITQIVATSVVMISVQSDRDYMRRAMQAGAVDFLPKPPSADELYATVRNAYDRRPTVDPGKADGDEQKQREGGKVIVFYSPQGGVGVTSLAVSVASELQTQQDRVVLMDCNFQFADAAVHLDINNERNMINLIEAAGEIDPELLQNVIVSHGTGLRVLAGPRTIEDAGSVTVERLLEIIDVLAKQYTYVVIDTQPYLNSLTVSLLDIADQVVMVCIPTLPCVKNVRNVLELFDSSPDFDNNKLVLAMNRVPPDRKSGALNVEDITKALKMEAATIIPEMTRPFLDALNRGVPASVNSRQSPGRELADLAIAVRQQLVTEEDAVEAAVSDEPKRRRGLFG